MLIRLGPLASGGERAVQSGLSRSRKPLSFHRNCRTLLYRPPSEVKWFGRELNPRKFRTTLYWASGTGRILSVQYKRSFFFVWSVVWCVCCVELHGPHFLIFFDRLFPRNRIFPFLILFSNTGCIFFVLGLYFLVCDLGQCNIKRVSQF